MLLLGHGGSLCVERMEKRPPSENTAGANRAKLSQGLTEQRTQAKLNLARIHPLKAEKSRHLEYQSTTAALAGVLQTILLGHASQKTLSKFGAVCSPAVFAPEKIAASARFIRTCGRSAPEIAQAAARFLQSFAL
ncbi:MAG: hypothetical protein ACFNZS_07870 [Ottowia sp.]